MSIKKIVLYGIILLILYHFSRYLTLFIIIAIVFKYAFKSIKSGKSRIMGIVDRAKNLHRNFLVKRKIKEIIEHHNEKIQELVQMEKSSTLYEYGKENFYLIIDGFKAILFSIIKIEMKTEKTVIAKAVEAIYEILSSVESGFRLVLKNTGSKVILYIVLYTANYTLRLTSDSLAKMANEVDNLRKALTISLSTTELREIILNIDVVRNKELKEVMVS